MKRISMILLTFTLVFSSVFISFANETVSIQAKYNQTEARRLLKMINDFRASDTWYWNEDNKTKTHCKNLGKLTYDYELEKTAMQRAAEIALVYDHKRPNGNDPFTAYTSIGYSAGENICVDTKNIKETHAAFREDDCNYNNQGHRRTMLEPSFTAVGIACVKYNGSVYWAEEFRSNVVDTKQTAALNSTKKVNIEIAPSMVLDKKFKISPSTINISIGDAPLPEAKMMYSMRYLWPKDYCPVDANVDWGSNDTSTVSIYNNIVTGHKLGSTTLTANCNGFIKSVKINVISPKLTLKAGKKSFTPKLNVLNKYKLRYSLKSNMKKSKTVSNPTKITKLKTKTKYYVQYKINDIWSTKQTIKTK